MVAAVQKNHKIISFDPFLTAAADRMAGISGPGLKLVQETRSGGKDMNSKVVHAMNPSLLGKGLDYMNRTMLLKMMPLIDELIGTTKGPFDLHTWCRAVIMDASTEAIWGSMNPFRSKKIAEDFWYFESHLKILLAKVFPSITARKACLARESVVQAMLKFARAGGYEDDGCSELAYSRWKIQKDQGATEENVARLETSLNIGVLSNTSPSTFWTIFEVCSRPDLLASIRDEVRRNAMTVDPETNTHAIDLSRIRDDCPILVSTFQGVLRVHANGAPTRMVYEDVVLDNTYLLKAGSILQMPSVIINNEESRWGSDAMKFDPLRFHTAAQAVDVDGKLRAKPRATSYLSFGVSPNLCPGRHFAAAEILALVAMMVMRVDIKPTKGEWWVPKLNVEAMAASITPPADDYPVNIFPREEFEGVAWTFAVSGVKDKFSLITG